MPIRTPNVGVIALVPDDWGAYWMGRHDLITRLARHFTVVWVNPARDWRSAWGLSPQAQSDRYEHDLTDSDLIVYDPGRWLPQVFRPSWLGRLVEWARLRRVRQILLHRGCDQIVVLVLRPELGSVLDRMPHDLACYTITDEYSYSAEERPIDATEAALIARADLVFISSKKILERKGPLNPRSILIPNGVDFEAYVTPTAEPDDLAHIPHPRMGYIGWIKEQLDLRLVLALASGHPSWSFVFIGPVRTQGEDADTFASLSELDNVYVLGNRPHAVLPGYFQHMDVILMPYRVDEYTRYIDPLKLQQGLAAGRPIVSTPVPAAMDLSHLVTIARTSDEWSRALDAALQPSATAPARVADRRAAARLRDWNAVVSQIADEITSRLADGASAAGTR